jgi:hypothetical protein
LEAICAITHLLLPFLPVGCKSIFQKFGKEPVSLQSLSRDGRNLLVGTVTTVGDVLYEKSLSEATRNDKSATSSTKKESYEMAQRRTKEAKAKQSAVASKQGQDG